MGTIYRNTLSSLLVGAPATEFTLAATKFADLTAIRWALSLSIGGAWPRLALLHASAKAKVALEVVASGRWTICLLVEPLARCGRASRLAVKGNGVELTPGSGTLLRLVVFVARHLCALGIAVECLGIPLTRPRLGALSGVPLVGAAPGAAKVGLEVKGTPGLLRAHVVASARVLPTRSLSWCTAAGGIYTAGSSSGGG